MKVISRTKIAQEKARTIQAGYNAFAETEEVSAKIKKELRTMGIEFLEEKTDMGCWFFPKK